MRIRQGNQPNSGQDRISNNQPAVAPAEDADIWINWRQAQHGVNDLDAAQRALELRPDDAHVQADFLRVLLEQLKRDPFVAFLAQSDDHYVITFRHSRPIVIPKSRGVPEIFPPVRKSEGEHALGLVAWMALGLVLAGLGTLFLFPIVFAQAAQILITPGYSPRDSRRAWIALFMAFLLAFVGGILTLILLLHLLG